MTRPSLRYPLRGINLKDAALFDRGIPHDIFRTLRLQAPVYWNEEPEAHEPGFWAITKYDDIVAISRNPALFSSALGGHQISYDRFMPFDRANAAVMGNMTAMDPPEHQVCRRLVAPFFNPGATQRIEPAVRRFAAEVIDRIASRGECEFVSEVAAELPLMVLCEMLGLPPPDRRLLFDWSNRITDMSQGPEAIARLYGEVFAYGQAAYAERRKNPTGDLMSAMATARIDGHPLDQQFLDGFFLLMVAAGNETIRYALAGGVRALAEHPDERRLMIDDPALIPGAVEEILRWVTPVLHFRRTATADTEISGQKIARGDKVVIWYPSANRDEDVFQYPDVFDVRREPNEHLAFGVGEHYCLGYLLARLELRVMFEEIVRRLPDIEPDGPIERTHSYFMSGITSMPVRFTPPRETDR